MMQQQQSTRGDTRPAEGWRREDPVAGERVAALARRHGVGDDAVVTLLRALERGGGDQAQFSHPDLGGMGQWSRHGMTMVGDMFDTALKARVAALCADAADLLRESGPVASRDAEGGARQSRPASGSWWPSACGSPASSGAQNDMRYAYFPDRRRLAIQRDGAVTLYDTGAHRITGVSQQQSGAQDLSFTSQNGTVRLHDLVEVEDTSPRPEPSAVAARAEAGEHHGAAARTPEGGSEDVFAKIERLHDLHRRGILDATEFAEKKRELLGRI